MKIMNKEDFMKQNSFGLGDENSMFAHIAVEVPGEEGKMNGVNL